MRKACAMGWRIGPQKHAAAELHWRRRMHRLPAASSLIATLRKHLAALEKHLEGGNKLSVATLATLLHAICYFVPNRFPLFEAVRFPLTAVDLVIPFIPLTAWLYFTEYVLVFVAFSRHTAPGHAVRFGRAFLFAVVVSTVIHLLWPVEYPRELFPLPEGTGVLSALGIQLLRGVDGARSCLPSLHVALATVAALSVTRPSRWSVPTKIWAILVTVSTMTTKQHYFYDVGAGAFVGVLAHALFARQIRFQLVGRGHVECSERAYPPVHRLWPRKE